MFNTSAVALKFSGGYAECWSSMCHIVVSVQRVPVCNSVVRTIITASVSCVFGDCLYLWLARQRVYTRIGAVRLSPGWRGVISTNSNSASSVVLWSATTGLDRSGAATGPTERGFCLD